MADHPAAWVVRVQRVGAELVDFFTVGEPVTVGVRVVRVGAQGLFDDL